jgi:polyisoprenoid-binding protein YceI
MLATVLLAAAVARPIDVARSSAKFSVEHVWVERVTGTVPIESGTVTLDLNSLVPTSVTATLNCADLKTDDPDRDAALRSPDFFDADRFATWTFTSTKIVPTGAASFGMDGMLTIHGVTQPEHLDVTVSGTPQAPAYHAAGKIDRKAFGMKVTRLDPVIGNPVDVTLDVTLK